MRFALGFAAGVAATWAAIAIWQRIPPIDTFQIDPEVDWTADEEDVEIDRIIYGGSELYDRYRRGEITRAEWAANDPALKGNGRG